MIPINFETAVQGIVDRDPRYHADAYHFLRDALDFTQQKAIKAAARKPRREDPPFATEDAPKHVTGHDLLDGIREYSLELFGPMATTVFEEWGITRTDDFGEIVFNMVEVGLLSKTDEDDIKDFQDVYDFYTAFQRPFLPQQRRRPAAGSQDPVSRPSGSDH